MKTRFTFNNFFLIVSLMW